MPNYEFVCDNCKKITLKLLSINSVLQLTSCEHCGENKARRIISKSNFCMKGYSAENGYSKEGK